MFEQVIRCVHLCTFFADIFASWLQASFVIDGFCCDLDCVHLLCLMMFQANWVLTVDLALWNLWLRVWERRCSNAVPVHYHCSNVATVATATICHCSNVALPLHCHCHCRKRRWTEVQHDNEHWMEQTRNSFLLKPTFKKPMTFHWPNVLKGFHNTVQSYKRKCNFLFQWPFQLSIAKSTQRF